MAETAKRTHLQRRAGVARGWFEQATRAEAAGGEEYWRGKDGAPQWVQDMCLHAHGDMMPEDWRYQFIVDALDILEEEEDEDRYSERIDSDTDVYNARLVRWLGSSLERAEYVDDGVAEDGWSEERGLYGALAVGQYREREEVLYLVKGWLEDEWQEDEGEPDE